MCVCVIYVYSVPSLHSLPAGGEIGFQPEPGQPWEDSKYRRRGASNSKGVVSATRGREVRRNLSVTFTIHSRTGEAMKEGLTTVEKLDSRLETI